LQLDKFDIAQILEYRVQQAEAEVTALATEEPPVPEEATRHLSAIPSTTLLPVPFVNAVAEGTATPGGGAVAALAGALSAALAEMVAQLTTGKKKYAEVEVTMRAIAAAAGDLRLRLMSTIQEDIQAFDAVMEAYRLPKEDAGRPAAIQNALSRAADVPLNVARLALDAMQLAEQVARQGNVNAVSDATVAVFMGAAAVDGAALNVRVNAASLDDANLATRYRNDISAIAEQAHTIREAVIAVAEERAGIAANP
jgi:formiminotetrahydrofolate cyclodeaminase